MFRFLLRALALLISVDSGTSNVPAKVVLSVVVSVVLDDSVDIVSRSLQHPPISAADTSNVPILNLKLILYSLINIPIAKFIAC
jgi:hypothetical protein